MVKRPNHALPNNHAFFFGATGSGKSQMLETVLPGSGVCVLGWDAGLNHKGLYYDDFERYEAVVRGMISAGSKQFRLFYTGGDENPVSEHERWSRLVWEVRDARRPTYAVDEEFPDVCRSIRAPENCERIVVQGRKHGLIHLGTGQRPQLVPNTMEDSPRFKYMGRNSGSGLERCAKDIRVDESEIESLKIDKSNNRIEFLVSDKELGKVTTVYANYREPVLDESAYRQKGYIQVSLKAP